uniref:Transmembrane protein 179 n=1 Tax=Riptortus pedestris TaxID=329032 RepID=R4WS95_RIPPE|nr:conserved hypothetical protein [Riptortus pedestris]
MALNNVILLSQMAGYVIAFILSLCIAVPMTLHQDEFSNFLSAFFDVVGCFVLCGLSLIAALVITFGFIVWCNDMTMRFPSCDMASGQDIDKQDGIDTSNFYFELGTAQFGAWASMACWVGLSIFALLKMFQQHEIQNMRASMLRERQHLINEAGLDKRNNQPYPEKNPSPQKF